MIQLSVRTEFSFGETFAPLDRIVARLKALGASAAGIVDMGTWGHVQWAKACHKAEITPLCGTSIAVLPELSGEDRPLMWFLATSSSGLVEMYRWSSKAQRQAIRGVPCLSYEDVRGMSGDIAKFAG